jgi:hypothetical protein
VKEGAWPYRDLGLGRRGRGQLHWSLGALFLFLDATDLQIVQRSKH